MAGAARTARGTTIFMTGLIGALLLTSGRGEEVLVLTLCTWFIACLAAESLWHSAPDEVTPLSMAPAAHLAALTTLPVFWGVPLVSLASLVGALLWRRAPLRTALHDLLTTFVAAVAALSILVLGGAQGLLELGAPGARPTLLEPRHFILIAVAGLVYLVLYQGMIALRLGKDRGRSSLEVWQEAFGREIELVTSVALITVATLAVFCFEALGYKGILLCVMPILFVRDGSRRNIELEQAQGLLIQNERLAAKGEMAAEIGHELNNYLAAISGRAQLVLRKLPDEGEGALGVEAGRVRDTANQMGELAKGLMDFSHQEVQRTSFGLSELIEKTVDFVRPQTRFRDWTFALASDPQIPRVRIDPGQIQQVLLILMGRIADCRSGVGLERTLNIRVFRHESKKLVGIELQSPGHGDPLEGEESMLDTVQRILDRHQGEFTIDDSGDGEEFRVLLPAA